MNKELVIVLDFGGQYNQLVARRVRECNVYCEIYSYKTDLAKIKEMNPKGIILTGGPNSCYEDGAPSYDKALFEMGIPVLGLCYGAQLMMHVLGGTVEKAPVREYGKTDVHVNTNSALFTDVSEDTVCWMSHFDYISKVAPGFGICAHTADCPVAAAENPSEKLYAIQFHPEVLHTKEGTKMLSNFVYNVCHCSGDWRMDSFVEHQIKAIREKVGSGRVLCALSGGVDSSVAAVLLSRAIGDQLTCVFVDQGLLRKNEGDEVEAVFNYDLPQDDEYYVHRIGRTGRAGRVGRSFSFVSGKEVYKLKEIQRYCKTKIYAQKVPSLDDVANTKMENILEDIDRIIETEDLTAMVNAIESKVNGSDYTAMDIAAAFLKMCTGMTMSDDGSAEDMDFGDTGAEEPGMVRLFINIGKKQKAKPGDILGALAGETGMPGKLIGTIDMFDKYTFVEVPREYAKDVLHAMQNAKIKGKSIAIEPANQK